jgi:ribonuclease P protein component
LLTKVNRFHGLGSLNYVYRKGQTLRCPYFGVRYITNNRNQTFRVAVVVSKKVAKVAPRRNRIRRRVYEAARHTAPKYLINEDIVITIFDDKFLDSTFELITENLENQLKKIASNRK